MTFGDYLALLICIVFPIAGAYLMVRCWNQIHFRQDKDSVYFQKYKKLLPLGLLLELVSIAVTIIWHNTSYYSKNYPPVFVIDVLLWLIVIPTSIYMLNTARKLEAALPEIPDRPLADDEQEYYREAFTRLFEDIRTSNANRKAEIEKALTEKEGGTRKIKAAAGAVGKAVWNTAANTLIAESTGIEPSHLNYDADFAAQGSLEDLAFYTIREIDRAAEKTLSKLKSDDPAEVRKTILQLLAAHDDFVKENRKITYDDPCYGPHIVYIMHRYLQTMSPFAYERILGLYNGHKTHIGIRVNIYDNLLRIVKKRQDGSVQAVQKT